tara:strand:- start:3512 stop:5986 length:2475 start_codon:yes stop_codon:yes gene_type:complete
MQQVPAGEAEKITITVCNGLSDVTTETTREVTWDGLIRLLTTHNRTPNKKGPMFSFARFKPGMCNCGGKSCPGIQGHAISDNVIDVGALTFDFDKGENGKALTQLDALRHAKRIEGMGHSAILTSSHSHNPPEKACYRIIFELSRPVTNAEFLPCWRAALKYFGIPTGIDTDFSARRWNIPSCPEESEPQHHVLKGKPLDVEKLLDGVEIEEITPRHRSNSSTHELPPASKRLKEGARARLKELGPHIKGESPNNHARHAAAMTINDPAFSFDEALEPMLEWNETCVPPWPQHKIKQMLNNAYDPTKEGYGWFRRQVEAEEGKEGTKALVAAGVLTDPFSTPPEALKENLLPVLPLDLDLLPGRLRPWIIDKCETRGVPVEFMAISSLVGMASLIGRHAVINIRQHADVPMVPNLWGFLIADSGTRKTGGCGDGIAPIRKMQSKKNAKYEAELVDYEREKEIFEILKKKAAKQLIDNNQSFGTDGAKAQYRGDLKDQEPVKPIRRTYVDNDSNTPTVVKMASESPSGFLSYHDELPTLLALMDKKDQPELRTIYMKGWNGDESHSSNRMGRGFTHVDGLCLSVYGGIQPDIANEWVRSEITQSHKRDGFMARWQAMIYPDPIKVRPLDKAPDMAAQLQAESLFEEIDRMPLGEDGGFGAILRFDSEAQKLFNQWERDNDDMIHELQGYLKTHRSKYISFMASLALILHIGDGFTTSTPVGVPAFKRAAKLVEYFWSHAKRIYAAAAENAGVSDAMELVSSIPSYLDSKGQFMADKLYKNRNAWNSERTHDACETLVRHRYLKRTGSKNLFEIHPDLLAKAKAAA